MMLTVMIELSGMDRNLMRFSNIIIKNGNENSRVIKLYFAAHLYILQKRKMAAIIFNVEDHCL
jgi:hypothetical protein